MPLYFLEISKRPISLFKLPKKKNLKIRLSMWCELPFSELRAVTFFPFYDFFLSETNDLWAETY